MEQNQHPRPAEQKIDFGAIGSAIKKHRKLYYKTLSAAFIIACLISLSIPDYYTCKVVLAPEASTSSNTGSLMSLASSFGVNLGGMSSPQGADAFTPSLYPDLMKSLDFKATLFPVKVKYKDQQDWMSYYDYLKNEWKEPWWNDFFGLMSPQKQKDTIVNTFELTGEQARIASMINKNVVCKIDKKTNLIDIDVTAQDPYIAAMLADSVKTRLQAFLTDYRTNKARHDLAYAEKLYKEAKHDYDRTRQLYGDFMDHNQDVILESVRQKQVDLENEAQLMFNNYTAVSAQLLAAKAKVQQETPAFTTLQSATVPLGKTGPKGNLIVLICLFLAALGTTAYALSIEKQLKPLLGIS